MDSLVDDFMIFYQRYLLLKNNVEKYQIIDANSRISEIRKIIIFFFINRKLIAN